MAGIKSGKIKNGSPQKLNPLIGRVKHVRSADSNLLSNSHQGHEALVIAAPLNIDIPSNNYAFGFSDAVCIMICLRVGK